MSVTSVTEGAIAQILKILPLPSAPAQFANVTSSAKDKTATEAAQPLGATSSATTKAHPATRQSSHTGAKEPGTVRHMSHVVEVYNPQGKRRLKFMDSSNNVIYQFPSEMVAKVQDLMMNPDTATDKKG